MWSLGIHPYLVSFILAVTRKRVHAECLFWPHQFLKCTHIQYPSISILFSQRLKDLYFSNAKRADEHLIATENKRLRIDSAGYIYLENKISAKLSCNMHFERFPMDVQVTCPVKSYFLGNSLYSSVCLTFSMASFWSFKN